MTDWAIPQQAKLKYTQLFNLHDRSRSGFLSGLQCRDILMQSGLPRAILAEIWNLSDIDGDGQLTREEFILAMHLTNQARAGQSLPQELPADLVPPSYRRTRSISTTSVHSAASSAGSTEQVPPTTAPAPAASSSTISDDLPTQKLTSETLASANASAGSILNSNSFEDKRRENFEKGRAELERRRQKIIEQQTSILSEQLVKCKKQVADAKAKIDSMRSDRDTKAGLITSLEAQLATVRERKAFLDHEEMQIIAIARDLNLVNSPNSAELDHQATIAKQESINQMKEKLADLEKERDAALTQLSEAQAQLDESKKELKTASEEVAKTYESYKEKIANAKILRQQFIDENKSKPIDLQSAWDAAPSPVPASQVAAFNAEPSSAFPASNDDPWSATDSFPSATKQPNEDPFSFTNKSSSDSRAAPDNNNDFNFEPARDFNSFSANSPKQKELSAGGASNTFNELSAPELTQRKKMYRVLYEFEARNPDELTINPGDIITGSEVVCEPGWLSGEINGKSGLFPEAYVEPLPAEGKLPSETTSNASAALNQSASGLLPQQQPAPQASPTTSTIVKYKVIYAFEARNPDELTINPGDIVTGVDLPHEPGWLMGELNAQRGLFPEAYVERLAEAQVDPATELVGTLRRGSSSGSLRSKKSSRAKKAEVATVIANYRALGQEQLNLEKGQLVLIRRKMDSGWWEGELQIKGPNGTRKSGRQDVGGNELDLLIGELVDSELDYVNDLHLCRSAYISPLSLSFDVSQIFINWPRLIDAHETALRKIHNQSNGVAERNSQQTLSYSSIFETFQTLLNSIVELYVDFCSRQNDATCRLEAKMASDIRFRQLVNESQRRLKKLVADGSAQHGSPSTRDVGQESVERAMRNSNLPLTTYLLKPMQRITKYGLLFDRMLALVEKVQYSGPLRGQLERLKTSARRLCNQVNEACRLKEDDQDNSKRLRWCQSHILQHQGQFVAADGQLSRPYSTSNSPLNNLELRMTNAQFLRAQSFSETTASPGLIPEQLIQFDSNTNCMGQRRLIKCGSLTKLRSGKELVAFLFSDFILLTQIKGGISLRAEDVFRSERAQQAYYKPYRAPVLLEDIQTDNFDNEVAESSLSTCHSLGVQSASARDHEAVTVSFLDRRAGAVYNLLATSARERSEWSRLLAESVQRAREARDAYQMQHLLKATSRLSINDCFGRLFVTVLELVRIANNNKARHSTTGEQLNNSWDRQRNSAPESMQNLTVRLQLRLYKRTQLVLDDDERREIVPTSDEFRTKPLTVCHATRQPALVDMNETMSNLELQRDVFKFNDNDSTQFLLSSSSAANGLEYLDIELMDDSRFRETRQLGRKRISLDQLLGRGGQQKQQQQQQQLAALNGSDSPASSRKMSIRSGRGVQPLQPNRPIEMTLKLKSVGGAEHLSNGAPDKQQHSPLLAGRLSAGQANDDLYKFNVKLRLHLQLFCDSNSLI